MVKRLLILACCAFAGTSAAATAGLPEALSILVQTERAFAASTRIMGMRNAFLQFFADDAVMFTPDPVDAKAYLRARAPEPFSARQLTWEPRIGDIAASGEIGWLSGPASLTIPTAKQPGPHHQVYLSVWRLQPGGEWRVIVDVGTGTPGPAAFEAGFTPLPSSDRYQGGGAEDHKASLASADQALNEAASTGLAAAYGPRLADASRLHRNSMMPLVGRDAIVKWLRGNAAPFTGRTARIEAAGSGDLGFTYGTYALEGVKPERGTYLRIWSRVRSGEWILVVDLTRPAH